MRKIIVSSLLLIFGMTFIAPLELKACEITFEVQGKEKKKSYKVGDEIVIKVEVQYTHRVCPEGIEKTKFTYDGLKVLGATKWKEEKTNLWTRKIKVKVTEVGDGKLKMESTRTCEKEGGSGSIILKVVE